MRNNDVRKGAAMVEFAVVASIFLMILFGIFEYARLIFTQQVMINASREGARFAVVNTTDANLTADTQAFVLTKMSVALKQLSNYTCQVYQANGSGSNVGAPTAATFGQPIAVQIDGDYSPLLPSFLMMNKTIHLTYKSMMTSEAN